MNLVSFKSFSATRVQHDPTSSTCKCTLRNKTDFTSTVPIKKIAHIKTHTNGSYLILQQVFFPRLLFDVRGIKTVLKFADLQGHIQITSSELFYYRPQRSCGQGNVVTGVYLSTVGEGVCLSACWDARTPQTRQTPRTRQTPPWDQADTPPGSGRPPYTPWTRQTPLDQADNPARTRQTPPGTRQTPSPLGPGRPHPPLGPGRHPPRTRQTPPPPPGKQTPAYGLRAAGTHPTGMHSCCIMFYTYYYNGHHHTPMRACERIGRYRESCAGDAHPIPANFLSFSCIFGKNWTNNRLMLRWGWRPLSRKSWVHH